MPSPKALKAPPRPRSCYFVHLFDGRLLEIKNKLDLIREIKKYERSQILTIIKGNKKELREQVRLTV